jgi:hypothetical protein
MRLISELVDGCRHLIEIKACKRRECPCRHTVIGCSERDRKWCGRPASVSSYHLCRRRPQRCRSACCNTLVLLLKRKADQLDGQACKVHAVSEQRWSKAAFRYSAICAQHGTADRCRRQRANDTEAEIVLFDRNRSRGGVRIPAPRRGSTGRSCCDLRYG